MTRTDKAETLTLLREIRDLLRIVVYGNSEKKADGGCCNDK